MTEPNPLMVDRHAINQAPPLVGHNVVSGDRALVEALAATAPPTSSPTSPSWDSKPVRPMPASTACSPTVTTPS
ncbi:MAG: hypothetical protein LH477_01735 [Nocardioides sp.]|nr:hypothetical protein [Nocardioides sp.]